ncbi:HAMP domain-containing sensor histidine kinase [Cohnella fermenti]|uniref:histidine kinase n=1 Tax=Cohnella fermenti TaxID=2565925 RepID=A0A4S4BI11_9BACL|nr:HAMP domain-containing sensor histidine kinase [Cohnella fermenti]THF73985.1 HAMP domain-containing histidine kinase [Cohnella fermenti]
MKLRWRLPILFSILVIGLTALIAVYIRTYVIGSVFSNVKELREERQAVEESIRTEAERLYPDTAAIESYVSRLNAGGGVTVGLYDSGFEPIGYDPWAGDGADRLDRQWYQVKDGEGRTALMLGILSPVKPSDVVLAPAFEQVFIILLLCLSVIFVGMALHLHRLITKPIQRLNNRLGGIRARSLGRPLATCRKDEIGELYRHVIEMEERLHRSGREQTDMIAAIAHDIKTPLTSVNGFVELLLTNESLSEQDRRDYLRLIEKKSHHLTELIQQFSSFTKDEAHLVDLELQPVKFRRFFESTAIEYEEELAGLGFALTWSHSLQGGETFLGHEPMLRRVFANLVSNAVRYGGREDLTVRLTACVRDGQAVMELEDNGIGVPEEHREALFRKFYTVDTSRQIKAGGTGLGLASCHSIVERHGGTIVAGASPLGGLGIRIQLPIEP